MDGERGGGGGGMGGGGGGKGGGQSIAYMQPYSTQRVDPF